MAITDIELVTEKRMFEAGALQFQKQGLLILAGAYADRAQMIGNLLTKHDQIKLPTTIPTTAHNTPAGTSTI